MRQDIRQEYKGRWASALSLIGIPDSFFSGRHGDCLVCGNDHKNARWHKVKEFYICSKCGVHNPVELAMHWLSRDFKETVRYLRGLKMNLAEKQPEINEVLKGAQLEINYKRIAKIRHGLIRLNGKDPASHYLANRGITELSIMDIGFNPAVEYWEDKKCYTKPTMCALFRTADGEYSTIHLTFLNPDGTAVTEGDKRHILPTVRPMAGGAIRLFKADGDTLAIAEGIETALSYHQLTGVPTWAAANAVQLKSFTPPSNIKKMIIIIDEDETWTGAEHGYALAKKLTVMNKILVNVVRLQDGILKQERPQSFDFNDYIKLVAKQTA